MSDRPIAAAAVLYAKDVAATRAFYEGVTGFKVASTAHDHVVLASPALELTIVQIPAAIAATIEIARPPVRRTETPIKLVFPVASLEAARAAAPRLGGELNPPEREWSFGPWRVCDGHDPEGNMFQLRQRAEAQA
ncbi:MAG TPA: VOC family protein [Burkholderiaceae bacterium]|nr:VOC family protein [Burkholderiaceae bacterium]